MERIALDVHAHLAPIVPDRLAEQEGAGWDADNQRLILDGHHIGLRPLFRPEALIAWMDDNGVEKAWISIPPLLYRPNLSDAAARTWSTYVNEGLAGIAERFPHRFEPMLHLPVERPELAAEITADWSARGRRRFAMPAGAGPKVMLSDERYEPLWQQLGAASAFLFLHPAEGCDPRLDPFYLHNLLGNPSETAVAATHLVFSGVLARHPGLTICLAHGGGTASVVAGRLERGLMTKRPGIDAATPSPRQMLRHLCVDCIMHDPAALELAATVFGAGNILFGSDWPFPMGLPNPHEQLAGVTAELRRGILSENAARLLDPR